MNRSKMRIKPTNGWASLKLQEAWDFRELLYFFVWRDVKVRYKQTILGAAWAVLQPFLTMVVFSLFFGRLAGVPSEGIPYPIFTYAALVPWAFFANGSNQAANSLVGSANLIKKVYFPRLLVPAASVMAGLVDFVLAFIILLLMMVYYGIYPTVNLIWLPLFLLLAILTTLGIGFWLSAMNIMFRDVRYAVPFMIQLWLFITPVAYPSSLLSEPWLTLYGLNPMAGVVEGFRWSLLGTEAGSISMIILGSIISIIIFVSGTLYFKRMERSFADII